MKIHYAVRETITESTIHEEWSPTICGLEYTESPLTGNIKEVTCKKCQKGYSKFEEEMEHAYQNM